MLASVTFWARTAGNFDPHLPLRRVDVCSMAHGTEARRKRISLFQAGTRFPPEIRVRDGGVGPSSGFHRYFCYMTTYKTKSNLILHRAVPEVRCAAPASSDTISFTMRSPSPWGSWSLSKLHNFLLVESHWRFRLTRQCRITPKRRIV